MKKIFFFLILIIIFNKIYSQKDFDNYKNNKDSLEFSCTENCMSGCLSGFSLGLIEKLLNHHIELIDKRDSLTFVTSADFNINFASNLKNKFITNPSFSARWGVFTFYTRLNYISDFKEFKDANFLNIEAMILGFSFIPRENINFCMGTGFFYDQISEQMYNENFLNLSSFLSKKKIIFNIEIKYVYDFSVQEEIFIDFYSALNYKFYDKNQKKIYFTIGGFYQNFYKNFDIFAIKTGINFNFY